MAEDGAGWGDFEFERKFFLRSLPEAAGADPTPDLIVQSYLLSEDGYAVRVRVLGPAPRGMDGLRGAGPAELVDALGEHISVATITAKGPAAGGTRYEAERELDPMVAGQMVRRGTQVVAKVRHAVWLDDDGWVIDDFFGANAPLLMAEVERGGPVTDLAIPDFCVSEVSEDDRFRNENLAHTPFSQWAQAYERELNVVGPTFVHHLGRNRLSTS